MLPEGLRVIRSAIHSSSNKIHRNGIHRTHRLQASGFRRIHASALPSSARQNLQDGLAGSGPFHKSCIFLHHPDPPSKYPPKMASELLRAVTLKAMSHRGLVKISWRSDRAFVGGKEENGGFESYPATVFLSGERVSSNRRAFYVPSISRENIDDLDVVLSLRDGMEAPVGIEEILYEQHIYVCTHGSRDCRCGDTGGAVVAALQEEIAKRRATVAPGSESPSIWHNIRVGELAHVGGHKYAANVLLYPGGEWLGLISPSDVPALLDLVASGSPEEASQHYSFVLAHSRGRMGVEKDVHRQLFEQLAETGE